MSDEIDKEKLKLYCGFWFALWLIWGQLFSLGGMPDIWAWSLSIPTVVLSQVLFEWNQKQMPKPFQMGNATPATFMILIVVSMVSCCASPGTPPRGAPSADDIAYRNAIWALKDASDRKNEYCKTHPTSC